MPQVKWIADRIEAFAPLKLAVDWDNPGLIIGDYSNEISKVLLALDFTQEVLEEGIEKGCGLIITHHPAILKPINKINSTTPLGRRILRAAENKICVYSAHTNLDITKGGINDTLCEIFGLTDMIPIFDYDLTGKSLARVGKLSRPLPQEEFFETVKKSLGIESVRFVKANDEAIEWVGVGAGACADIKAFKEAKEKGASVYITGDIKYHQAQAAQEMNLNLIDVTHYASEIIIMEKLKAVINEGLTADKLSLEVMISEVNGQTFQTV